VGSAAEDDVQFAAGSTLKHRGPLTTSRPSASTHHDSLAYVAQVSPCGQARAVGSQLASLQRQPSVDEHVLSSPLPHAHSLSPSPPEHDVMASTKVTVILHIRTRA
jgi:hypothetical protein